LAAALGGVFLFIFLSAFGCLAVYRYMVWRSELNNLDWLAAWTEIYLHQRSHSNRSISSATNSNHPPNGENSHVQTSHGLVQVIQRMKSQASIQKSGTTKGSLMTKDSIMKTSTLVATFRTTMVLVRPCRSTHIELSGQVRSEVRLIKTLACESLLKFVAACIEPEHIIVLAEYCSRGTLQV
jgi:hypothetical protein